MTIFVGCGMMGGMKVLKHRSPVGGPTDDSLLEKVIERVRPENWTWAIRGSSPPPCPFNVCTAHHSHRGSHFQGHSLDRAMCKDHL